MEAGWISSLVKITFKMWPSIWLVPFGITAALKLKCDDRLMPFFRPSVRRGVMTLIKCGLSAGDSLRLVTSCFAARVHQLASLVMRRCQLTWIRVNWFGAGQMAVALIDLL